MKKIIVLLVVLLCFSGCTKNGSKDTAATVLDEYEDLYCYGDGEYMFANLDDGSEWGKVLIARLTSKQREEYNSLDIFDEAYQEKVLDIVKASTSYKVIDLNECVPDQSEFDKYVGQKVQAMIDDGYENNSKQVTDNLVSVFLDGLEYSLMVDVEEYVSFDDLNDEMIPDMTIKAVTYLGPSWNGYMSMAADLK